MSEQGELLSEAGMEWEREVRGYNRQQVDNYVAWRAGQVRELESRLSQSIAEIEHLRHELADVRASARRPPHEEISERVGQILKLAADEAKAEREHGAADANDLREAAKKETDKPRSKRTGRSRPRRPKRRRWSPAPTPLPSRQSPRRTSTPRAQSAPRWRRPSSSWTTRRRARRRFMTGPSGGSTC